MACGARSGRRVENHQRTTERHTPKPARVPLAELLGFIEIALSELRIDLRLRIRYRAKQEQE
jgi:hypothetical protein